ncbi:MAG: cysteine--tRNA ligase [Halanaerobiaceae bacterium]
MIRVYNTLTGKKEKFEPFEPGKVKMYICGLTVQNYSHLGHIRSAINYDVIRRYLEYSGYEVFTIQNFTDINEKIVVRAGEEGLTPAALAEKYTRAYLDDIEALNIMDADVYCSVSDNIAEIQEMVQTLIDKGYAYESGGNVYFSVEKFPDYGKLSGRELEEMEAGSRVAVKEEKKHPLDFALWKRVDEDVRAWNSPWGRGWPGWHIECSAMAIKYLGERFDIHGGGTDLIFPHHENEIAQSEAYTGKKPFVKYWLHNGTVNLSGSKMSKSEGNFFTTRELLDKFSPDVLRYFLLAKHYHSPIDFSLDGVKNTRVSYERLLNTRRRLESVIEDKNLEKFMPESEFEKAFKQAMDDNFNTAEAIGVFNELAREINSRLNNFEKGSEENLKHLCRAARIFDDIASVLGLRMEASSPEVENDLAEKLINYLLELREGAREEKNWKLADKIRDDLREMGIVVEDTRQGVEWTYAGGDSNGD